MMVFMRHSSPRNCACLAGEDYHDAQSDVDEDGELLRSATEKLHE